MSYSSHSPVPHTWRNAPYTDWTVIIDDTPYPVHRYFLGCGLHCSSYFNSQFRAQDKDQFKTDLSSLPKSCKIVWEKVLDFIYQCDCKQFTVKPNEVVPLLCISDYLQIPSLTQFIDKIFQEKVEIPMNSLQFYIDSIYLQQEKSLIISQKHVTKHFSNYSPDSFSMIPFDCFEVLLNEVSEHVRVIENPEVVETIDISIVKSILYFIENNDNIKKEQFEKLIDIVKGGEKEDILNLLIKSHNLGSERYQDLLVEILMKDFEQLDISILSKLPTQLFIKLIERSPKLLYQHKYNSIVEFVKENELSSTEFDKIMQNITKVKHKHLGIFTPLSEKFDSHFDKCMTPMANHFSYISFKDLSVLQLNRFIGLLSNDELKVTSEDNVFDSIVYYIEKNSNQLSPQDHIKLWSCCRFAFLSLKYLVMAQESIYNIPQHLLIEGLTFAKFKSEMSVDSPLWSILEDYKKKSKTSNLFRERKPKNRVVVSLSKLVQLSPKTSIKSQPVKFLVETFDSKKENIDAQLDISVLSSTNDMEEFTVNSPEMGKYIIQFIPKIAGSYTIHVKHDHKLIGESPLSFIVVNPTVCKNESDVLKCIQSQVPFSIEATKLELGYNSIRDEGAKAIGYALQGNTTLTQLKLHRNSIGDEGAKAIGFALQGNTTLMRLELDSNYIGDDGAKAIGSALQGNTTLTELNLNNNKLSSTLKDDIRSHYWRNRNEKNLIL